MEDFKVILLILCSLSHKASDWVIVGCWNYWALLATWSSCFNSTFPTPVPNYFMRLSSNIRLSTIMPMSLFCTHHPSADVSKNLITFGRYENPQAFTFLQPWMGEENSDLVLRGPLYELQISWTLPIPHTHDSWPWPWGRGYILREKLLDWAQEVELKWFPLGTRNSGSC